MKNYLLTILIYFSLSLVFAQTSLDYLSSNPEFNIFATAIYDAGLSSALQEAPYTIFLPSNEAFARLAPEVLAAIGQDRNLFSNIIKWHIVAGSYDSSMFLQHPLLNSLSSPLRLSVGSGYFYAENARLIETDIATVNGFIHRIDELILPPHLRPATEEVRYLLDSKNQSGVIGSVIISGNEEQSRVSVLLSGSYADSFHPAKIHYGDCGSGGEIMAGLNAVAGSYGLSYTVLNIPLSSLLSTNAYVNIQLSAETPDYDLACGELGLGALSD